MNREAFEAALRLILPGPADQPLMRLMRIALDIADCPMGTIGVRRETSYDVIVSAGLPLAEFATSLPRSEEIAAALRVPRLIEDASAEPAFASHPYVTGPAGWRFMASVPLPLTILPYPVLLNCGDPRIGVERRPDLLERLQECAAIAADELRLIGDIAFQAEKIGEQRTTSALRDEGIRAAGVPMALVERDGGIAIANDQFRSLSLLSGAGERPERLGAVFPGDETELDRRLAEVMELGRPAAAIPARLPGSERTYLVDLMRVATMEASQPRVLCTVTDRTRTLSQVDAVAAVGGDPPAVISDFLLSTLLWQKRLLRRGPVSYHALSRWRATIKDTQIAAVKALKRDPGGYFLDQLTDRMVAAATALFGRDTYQAVVPVPCGNSGPRCLSERLARKVADRLGLPFVEAFEPLPALSSSHPRQNTRRTRMVLKEPLQVPVLLIDDIATSGAHIEEAALLLHGSCPAVLPLVWIAD